MRGMNQVDLARASGVAQNTISEIELGKREARPGTLKKLADALKVEISDLLGVDFPKARAPLPERGRDFLEYIKTLDREALAALSDQLDEEQLRARSASDLADVAARGLMVRLQMRIVENPDVSFEPVQAERAEAERKLEVLAGAI
jgi:transcriptional regulator with XRE-family HTH domain